MFDQIDQPVTSNDSPNTEDIVKEVILRDQMMLDVNPEQGSYMSCMFMFRGTVSSKEVNQAIGGLRRDKTIRFVDWTPTGFKCGLSERDNMVLPNSPIRAPKRSVAMLANSTAVSQVVHTLNEKFDLLFGRRAFVHWYVAEVL